MAREQRKLAAIVAADVVGYSRLMGRDESGTLARLRNNRSEHLEPALAKYGGRLVKLTGDGALVEFGSAVDALSAAIQFQQAMAGVREAPAGGILISGNVRDAVGGRLKATFEDMGGLSLKNIERPVQAFSVEWEPSDWQLPVNAEVMFAPAAAPQISLPLPDKPSIAVLPFTNMSGDAEQDYFADGMVEDIITGLSRFKELFVIARNSSFTYKGRAIDVKQVGRELGVRYVLEGSARKAASRVRITGQLVDTTTGAHLWANRIDGGIGDHFDLQDQVTESIVGAIAPAIQKAEIERTRRKPTGSMDAYDYYLRGLVRFNQSAGRQENAEALRLFSRAIEIDPEFASAYGRAAICYALAKGNGWISSTADEIAEVSRLAQRAARLGTDDAIALATGGYALVFVVHDLEVGAALVDRALLLNPNLADAWNYSGWAKVWLGEPELALERFARALRLNPLDPWVSGMRVGTAHAHFFLGRYAEAASWAAMASGDNPVLQPGLRIEAASNAMAGRREQAHHALARLQQQAPKLRISNLKDKLGPYRRAEDVSLYQEGLRLAGLPE